MLELALTFNRSLDRLTAAEQASAKQIAFDYMADPTRPGLSLHRADRARDKRFWTIRVNRDLRIVVFREGQRSVFCYVGHHEDAYAWTDGAGMRSIQLPAPRRLSKSQRSSAKKFEWSHERPPRPAFWRTKIRTTFCSWECRKPT
jgi:hypothetical protein